MAFDMNQCGPMGDWQTDRMTTLDEREHAFEHKFAANQELAFKVAARRNALLGWWTAWGMGLTVKAAEDYVKALVAEGVVHTEPTAVVARVMQDLLAKGAPVSRKDIEARIQQFTAKARAEIVRDELSR
jgi:hypothetical protein